MSSRALRRAQKGKESELKSTHSSDDEEIVAENGRSKNLFQQFSLLNDEDDVEEEEEASEEEQEKEKEEISRPVSASGMKNNKKKPKSKLVELNEDNFDEFFEKHCGDPSATEPESLIAENPVNEALSVDASWLDANAELKKKFGGAVGGGNSVLSEINSRALRQNPALLRAIKRKPFKRKNGFITPRPLWPPFGPTDTGLSVKLVHKCENYEEYEIAESKDYQAVFEELEMLVRTGDLEFLIQLIHGQPLFVDGLLLLSDAYRMQSTGDAGEIVERALYVLERILPTDLSFISGRSRFRYSHPPNRKLHLCLFRHLQFTMKKGCWRVSLQLAKALLALDPEIDPLGTRLFLDFLAIQSDSFEDFDRLFINLKGISKFGPILPGWFFNNSLRVFLDEETRKSDHSASSRLLSEAFSKCPGTGRLLLQALKLKTPEIITTNSIDFDSDSSHIGAAKIFTSRCLSLWKTPSIQKWVEQTTTCSLTPGAQIDLLEFKSVPLIYQVSIYRHSLLSDLSPLNVAIPKEITSFSSLNAYDPLPPETFDAEDKASGTFKAFIESFTNLFARQ